MKYCYKCKLNLEEKYFNKNKSKYDSLSSQCKECGKTMLRIWRKLNPEAFKIYYKENPDYFNIKQDLRKLENPTYWKEFYRANIETETLRKQIYRKANLDKGAALTAKHRGIRKKATPKWLTKDQLREMENFYTAAVELGKKFNIPFDVDHIIPIKAKDPVTGEHIACGLHVPWNLQVLPASLNRSYNDKLKPQSNPTSLTPTCPIRTNLQGVV